ncbi:LCP family protein [Streptomyces sp. V4-01]|uniref:LCP family protein n=1 Tax=Actinacidiphila polyblastidii TaxID=3110430 RepID=A0ABU7PG38_9ACTN|nr:LCP family protein [Streptomyces sp. V4-01]
MRDGTPGSDGYGPGGYGPAGAAPGGVRSGGLDWDQVPGPYRDDAGTYAPPEPGIPGPRAPEPEAGPAGVGAGGQGGGAGGQGGGGHRRGGRRRVRSRRRRVLKWIAIAASLAVLGSAGAAYGYYEYLSGKIRKGQRVSGQTSVAKPKANADGTSAMNILILGSDSRDSAEDAELGGAKDATGERADVIMIAHLSADRTNMSVVSIPRDTRVHIPPCTDPKTGHLWPATEDIINASLGRGGAGCTLATVQNLTKVYIDHWMQIDFAGVVQMAQVVGGVDVCVKQPVQDHPTASAPGSSHLLLKKAGRQTITDPKMALAWLRARHPFMDDAGRAEAQHMYMSSLIRKLRSQNLFTSPSRLNHIATTAMSAFKVSEEIGTPKKLYDLGMQLKTVPPQRITMLTMPHDADPLAPAAHYVPSRDADTVWSLVRNDTAMDANGKAAVPGAPSAKPTQTTPAGPAAAAPSTLRVTVVNGTAGGAGRTPVPLRAKAVATALNTAGFTLAAASQQADPSPATTLLYPASAGAQGASDALSVAKVFKIPAADVKPSTSVQQLTLTVGSDWRTGLDFSRTAPKAGSVPTSAQALNGADDTTCMPVYWPYVYHGS